MKLEEKTLKHYRKYIKPKIEEIQLDQNISIQLQSQPPLGPGELSSNTPEYFDNDPFKNQT